MCYGIAVFLCDLGYFMSSSPQPKVSRKMLILASLGILIPIFIVGMAFFAIKSDAENKRKYEQQHQEQLRQIEQREKMETNP